MVSFWKSTNALRGRARREWTAHTGAESVVPSSSVGGAEMTPTSRKPAARAASRPARAPSRTQASRRYVPRHAPAAASACTGGPGRKQPRASSKRGRPPDCA